MTFGTVIEIIIAIFTVFGLYSVSKMIAYILAYDKEIRGSIYIAVEIDKDDDEETRELKKLCARSLSLDTFGHARYLMLNKEKD